MHTVGQAMIASENGMLKCDVIDYEGELWLAPHWLDNPSEGWTTPARIIPLRGLQHAETNFAGCKWVVNHPIPRAVLDGGATAEEAAAFRVVERPPIRFEGPAGRH